MKIQIAYPVPCETEEVWQQFKPFVERFARTFKQFPPGVKCTVVALGCEQPVCSEARMLFHENDVPTHCETYPGKGMDLGSQQWLAAQSPGTFQLNLTTRCYFHRVGWLARLVKARLENGPGLFACSTSWEGGRFHVCTRAFAYDTDDFNLYPTTIVSRDQGVFFECGDGNLFEWFRSIGRPVHLVNWLVDSEITNRYDILVPSGFRDCDQSEMLIHDKHSDSFRDADESEKERLQINCYGRI